MATGHTGRLAGTPIPRRALFGLVLAATVTAGLATGLVGAGAAHADTGDSGGDSGDQRGGAGDVEYEIPDEIGSIPWW